ncbi:MAG: aminotransferase class I/II-fold pyridoxal phosphate-dependent enzyme [Oscillospiraceae bacterium]|nr:aminotransferase class I/II-fold pyridoxal phosphate-dependent enzyme [Oscillospiraceae bacterium]
MLYDKIKEYTKSGAYPMHMPGHKRNAGRLPPGLPYDIDITEIQGFDDLYNPVGILRETADLAAKLYGSSKAFLLVNGSTVGILAAIGAHCDRGEKVLITSTSHRSVYNATALFGLETIQIPPEIDETTGIPRSVDPASVESALKKDDGIKLVVATSPTYEGVISDIGSIARAAHTRGIPLIVDSAHGAHLGFSPGFPGSTVRAGADVVIMSLHKTLPALTQCSLLHICGDLANARETARLLSVLQTSSPSYVLMASIDSCLRLLASEKDELFGNYARNLDRFRYDIQNLKNLYVPFGKPKSSNPGFFDFDPGKIIIVTKNTSLNGFMLADLLRNKYMIEPELATADYVVAMTSVCDSSEGFSKLANALVEIDRSTIR